MRYALANEAGWDCEWEFFAAAKRACKNLATKVILDTQDSNDPDYPEGFHFAHLCNTHALRGLKELQARNAPEYQE